MVRAPDATWRSLFVFVFLAASGLTSGIVGLVPLVLYDVLMLLRFTLVDFKFQDRYKPSYDFTSTFSGIQISNF